MKKKIAILLSTVILLLAFASCETDEGGTPTETPSQTASTEDTQSDIQSTVSYESVIAATYEPEDENVAKNWLNERTDITDINAGDYDDIITKTVSPSEVDGSYLILTQWNYYYFSASHMVYKTPIDEEKFECYRTATDNIYYTVAKLNNGTLIYTYYRTGGRLFSPSYAIAASKKLSSADFENISVGDKLEKVYEIEPAANQSNYIDKTSTIEAFYKVLSRKVLLTDGILEFKYEVDENGEQIITEKILYSDFKTVYPLSDTLGGELDYTILEKDYPKN